MKNISNRTIKLFMNDAGGSQSVTKTYTYGDPPVSFDVVFKTRLTVEEKSLFIRRVTDGCFDALGNYRPEYVGPVFKATALQMLTNISPLSLKGDVSTNGLPILDLDAMDELYEYIKAGLSGEDKVVKVIDEMESLCLDAIAWKKKAVLKRNEVEESTVDLINKISEKIEGIDTEQLMDYAAKIANSTSELDDGKLLNALVAARDKVK